MSAVRAKRHNRTNGLGNRVAVLQIVSLAVSFSPLAAAAPGFETRCPTRWCDGPCTLWTGCTQCPEGFERYRNSIGQLLCRPPSSPPPPPPPHPPSPQPPLPAQAGTLFSGRAGSGGGVVASGAGFACPFPVLSPWQRRYYASIALSQWDGSKPCGRCAEVRCADPRCRVRDRWLPVVFLDQCSTCGQHGISTSDPAFSELTGLQPPGLVDVQWRYVDCRPVTQGGIRLDPKPGGNRWWQEIYIHNSAEPIASVSLNGTPLTRSTWGFWVHNGVFEQGRPHTLAVVSESSGRRVATTVTDLFRGQELSIQF